MFAVPAHPLGKSRFSPSPAALFGAKQAEKCRNILKKLSGQTFLTECFYPEIWRFYMHIEHFCLRLRVNLSYCQPPVLDEGGGGIRNLPPCRAACLQAGNSVISGWRFCQARRVLAMSAAIQWQESWQICRGKRINLL
jgi:hypothetical protein